MSRRNDDEFSMGTILKIVGAVLVVLVLGVAGCCCTERIEAGNVGLKVNLVGSDKERGVQGVELCSGWTVFNPMFSSVIEFPTAVQNIVWTKNEGEGHPDHDESITMSSQEGVSINTDISVSFRIDPSKAAEFYVKFRQTNLNIIAHTYMRNTVREAFNSVASKMPVGQIYGAGKNELLNKVLEECRKVLDKDGFIIEQITINSQMRLPQNIVDSINTSISATQQAVAAENKVRQVEAESKQVEAKAKGEADAAKAAAQGRADSMLIEAEGKAKAWKIEADAQANYNRVVGATATPAMIQYDLAQKWNGQLPQITSSGGVLTNVPR